MSTRSTRVGIENAIEDRINPATEESVQDLVLNDKKTQAFDYDVDGNIVYIGSANPGSSKASPVWKIKKITYSNGKPTDIAWASGSNQESFIWNNRASLIYS